jgi:hypothetical protein
MYYTVYKITNQINGKIYIGIHKTKDLNDNYMGSGRYLLHSQQKCGIENFTKEILFVFDTAEEMYAKEAEIVNEEFLATENTYNLKIGGSGGYDYINKTGKNLYGRNGINGLPNLEKGRYRVLSEIEKKKISDTLSLKYKNNEIVNPFYGKKHSKQTKKIIAEKAKLHQSGKNNSQYGTRWIHSMEMKLSKKIKKNDPLPEGWCEGRKLKF